VATPKRSSSRSRRASRPEPSWVALGDEELLDVRLCDLDLRIEGTWLETMVQRLHKEMARRGLRVKPHCWLSNEWYSPDGVPGIAIPFYLAHPRLMKLERKQMFEVEGGTQASCMRLLRHEAGHAIDTAYRLRRKKRFGRIFGRASRPYPSTYRPRADSHNHVHHLAWWYAQSHPVEDFAETFAVWLKPGSRWRTEYADWPVYRKLAFVDEIMPELSAYPPPVRTRAHVEPLRSFRRTLRSHYRLRRQRYGVDLPDFYDQQLERVFAPGRVGGRETAAAFLRRNGKALCRRVVDLTGLHVYTVDQFLDEMITRSRRLKLRRTRSESRVKVEATILLAAQVMGYVDGGGHHVAL
jgi:hypothetical protein